MLLLKIINCLLFTLVISAPIIGQIQYFKNADGIRLYPQSHQLYPRMENDKAAVTIKGMFVNTQTVNEVELSLSKHFLDGSSQVYTYQQSTTDSFDFEVSIDAGMYLYSFTLLLKNNQSIVQIDTFATDVVSGDVYIISGQSNAMGVTNGLHYLGARQDSIYQEYPAVGSNKIYSKSFGNMPEYNGLNGFPTNYSPNRNNWVPAKASPYNNLVGFVGLWGLKLQYRIQEQYQMPTCFINGAYGGTNLVEHQLSASPTNDPYDLQTLFGTLNYRVQQANIKGKIKGVIWYQGENESTSVQVHTYTEQFNFLIDTWESYWGDIEKIYVVQIHTGCNYHNFAQPLREYQRTMQRSINRNSQIISTTASGIGERASALYDASYQCHFVYQAYNNLADRLFQVLGRDFYQASTCITSPNIVNAYYSYNELILEFDQVLAALPEGIEESFEFYQNDQLLTNTSILAASIDGNKIHFTMSDQDADAVSYLLIYDPVYNNEMIWVKNPTGYGAFSFHKFPIHILPCANSSCSIQSTIITNQSPLQIHLKSCTSKNKLSLYSVQGQVVFQKELPFLNIETSLDLKHLAQGVYFLSVESDGHFLETQKIVKY